MSSRDTNSSAGQLWPRWREDDVAPTLIFVSFAAVAACMPVHNDTWWLLRYGREMWQSMTVLQTEGFSYSAYGTPLYNHEWLTQVVYYALFYLGGPFLLTTFCAACVLGAVWSSSRLMHGAADTRLGLLLLLMIGAVSEWAIRPQAMSLALLMVCVYLALTDRIVWLPLVCVAWSNAHGVVLLGIVVAGCAVLESLTWSRTHLRRDVAVATGSVLAPMLTPLGWHYWPHVHETIVLAQAIALHEYRSAFEPAQTPFWLVVVALIVLTIRSGQAFFRQGRANRLLWLVSSVLAVAGALAVRNIPFFFLVAIPTVSRLLTEKVSVRSRPAGPRALAVGLVVAVATAGGIAYRWRDGGRELGWRPMSVAAADAIRGCPDPIFNGFADGGPIIWFVPERRVFVDSRVEPYPLEFLNRSRRADLYGDYKDLFRDYGVQCAVVATNAPMSRRLAKDETMALRFADRQWSIFERTPER
jgi:hypothetical protein